MVSLVLVTDFINIISLVLLVVDFADSSISLVLGRLLWERKTYTKMDQIRFFYSGPKVWSGRLLWERKTYTKMDQIDRSGCVLIFFKLV